MDGIQLTGCKSGAWNGPRQDLRIIDGLMVTCRCGFHLSDKLNLLLILRNQQCAFWIEKEIDKAQSDLEE